MPKLLNLIDSHFQNSNLFAHLPIFDAIYYEGHPEGKIQKYKAVREDQECLLLALSIIRQEEDVIWQSAEDFLKASIIEAASRMHGVYTFDLLTFDIQKEVKTFNYNELILLLINHSRKLPPGEQKLIKYSSAYGILQKLVVEDWGKVTLKTSVDVFKQKPQHLDAVVRQLFRLGEFSHKPLIVVIHDLSSQPIYDPTDKIQQDLLMSAVNKQAENTMEFLPEVYIQDKNGVRELLSQSNVK